MEEKDLALIDAYLQGELSEADRTAFEERIARNPELARRLNLVKDMALANRLKTDAFRDNLRAIAVSQIDTKPADTPVRRLPLRWLSVAASVLLLLAAAYFLWPAFGSNLDGQELFAANFEPYPNNITARNTAATPLEVALGQYDAGQYEAAAQSFADLINTQASDTLHFYGGLSYLAAGQATAARQELREVVNDTNSIYQAQAQWYLALAFLQQEKIEAAKEVLTQLANSEKSTVHAGKATELLEKLE